MFNTPYGLYMMEAEGMDNMVNTKEARINASINDFVSLARRGYDINDIQILLILVTSKFLLTYYNSNQEVDYSLINLTSIKPKYINILANNPADPVNDNASLVATCSIINIAK